MSIVSMAEQVKSALTGCVTFTLYGGCALRDGKIVRFPQGQCELEKRNRNGQVSLARYIYEDGSRLTYRRKPDNEYSLTVTVPK